MDRPQDTSGLPAWDLIPQTAARLAENVDSLHTSTCQPRHEILAAIINAGLDRHEEIEFRLAERRLAAVIAALPPDTRPAPDLSAHDMLLTRRAGRHGEGSEAADTRQDRSQARTGRRHP